MPLSPDLDLYASAIARRVGSFCGDWPKSRVALIVATKTVIVDTKTGMLRLKWPCALGFPVQRQASGVLLRIRARPYGRLDGVVLGLESGVADGFESAGAAALLFDAGNFRTCAKYCCTYC